MTAAAHQLLLEALKFPPETRKAVAETLLESVVPAVSASALSPEELAEFSRRSRELRAGEVRGEPALEMIAELLAPRRAPVRSSP
jgi:hypothetical protein